VRIVAALILTAGLIASAVAIFSEQLGLGAEVARGMFGWKRASLLIAGVMTLAAGAALLARPRFGVLAAGASKRLWERFARRLVATGRTGWAATKRSWTTTKRGWAATKRYLRATGRAGWIALRRALALIRTISDRHLTYLAVGLLALLALVLVWTRLRYINQSFWHDEAAMVVDFSGVGLGAILLGETGYRPNNHVLYSLLSWATVGLVGDSEATHRLWSVVPGIAAVGVGAWWAWRRLGPVVAVAFATIAVAGPLHLEYVPQARGYGLTLLAATLTLIAADRLTRAYSKWTLLGFLGAGLVGVWTLFIYAIAFVGQALALLRWPRLRLPVIAALVVAGLLSVLFYAPVLDRVIGSEAGGAAGAGRGQSIPLTAALLLDRPLEWLVIPTVSLLTGGGERASIIGDGVAPDAPWATWIDVATLTLLVLGLVALWRRGEGGLALLLLAPPLFFNLAFSLGDQSTVTRHQLFLLPYIGLLVAVGIEAVGRMAAKHMVLKPLAVGIGAAAVLLLSHAIVEDQRDLPRENFKEVTRVVEGTEIDTVVTDSPRPLALHYYLGDGFERRAGLRIETLLCGQEHEMIYIRHLPYRPDDWRYGAPADLDCLTGARAVRVRVPQRDGAKAIDVWIATPLQKARDGTHP
jgi:hypothetical protein